MATPIYIQSSQRFACKIVNLSSLFSCHVSKAMHVICHGMMSPQTGNSLFFSPSLYHSQIGSFANINVVQTTRLDYFRDFRLETRSGYSGVTAVDDQNNGARSMLHSPLSGFGFSEGGSSSHSPPVLLGGRTDMLDGINGAQPRPVPGASAQCCRRRSQGM